MNRRLLLTAFSIVMAIYATAQSVYNVKDFGAKGDGKSDDAVAIQKAIDKCSGDGGGQVLFPRGGTFVTGPIELKSNIDIHLESTATLLANPDESIYHLSAFGKNEGEGMMWIHAKHAENISITGQGTIDGNGIAFMGKELFDSYELKPVTTFDPRPHPLTLVDIKRLIIKDVTIRNGAYWTVHLVGCNDALIDGISLMNNLKIRNGDGIDVDHSKNVRIANCHITSGDDCICLKNRREFEEYGPCKNITVTNCVMASRSCAIKIGSENMDSIANVLFDNCVIYASNRGLGIQNRDEGTVTDVTFSNIQLDCRLWSDVWWGKAEPIYVTSYPRANGNNKDANWRFPKGQIEGKCGEVSRIFFNNITAVSENGCFIGGDTDDKVNNIYLNNINLRLIDRGNYQGGTYDKRPCKGEGFVKGKVYGVYTDKVSNVFVTGLNVSNERKDYGGEQNNCPRRLSSVNTMVGTAQANTQSAGLFGKGSEEHGQTLPAVLVPNGQNFWTPQTQDTEKKCVAPYYYKDTKFQGFRNSHWIVGGCTQDYGSFTVTAISDSLRLSPEDRATSFSHSEEESHPYYYSVRLPEEHLTAEITGLSHAGIMRVTAEKDELIHIVLNTNSDEDQGTIEIDTVSHRIYATNPVHRIYQGWGESAGFSGYFVLDYPTDYELVDHGTLKQIAWLTFRAKKNEPMEFLMSSSFTSKEGAEKNLLAEIGRRDFDAIEAQCIEKWQQRFNTIVIEDTDESKVNQFYGALYRASFLPREMSDCDGTAPRFASSEETKGKGQKAKDDGQMVNGNCQMVNGKCQMVNGKCQMVNGNCQMVNGKCQMVNGNCQMVNGNCQMVNGRYQMVNGKWLNCKFFGDFSMWDIYRAELPLYNIITPTLSGEMMQSLTKMYDDGGWIPIFPCWNSYTAAMIGDHASVALADAYVKGIRGFDAEKAYEAMRKNAFESPASFDEYKNGMGRRALKSYLQYNYIPLEDSVKEAFHTNEQTSRTLEYAFDDFAVAQMAKALGKTDDYKQLMTRSGNWRNVINRKTGYADGRHADGTWTNNADQIHRKSYITEGATCHYTWYVPQDVKGLISYMPQGKKGFIARLDSMFTEGRYWHGNEPCHQVAYLYDYAGEPWKTQKYVRHILDTEYNDTPGGLSGNDDAGQMSAWYIFSTLGFYPVCPSTTQYAIGSPSFRKVTFNLENGKQFTIEAENASSENIYIQSATLNGKPLKGNFLDHADILNGGTLHFVMGNAPKY